MTMHFLVRQLTNSDVASMRQLNAVFGEAFSDRECYGAAPPSDAYLARLLATQALAVVALVDERVVGGLVAYELVKFERERSEIYIYDLAVAEPHRRKGIATALIKQLAKIAAQRGAWVMYVQADYVDPPAIELYQKLGTREDVLHFDIPVDRS